MRFEYFLKAHVVRNGSHKCKNNGMIKNIFFAVALERKFDFFVFYRIFSLQYSKTHKNWRNKYFSHIGVNVVTIRNRFIAKTLNISSKETIQINKNCVLLLCRVQKLHIALRFVREIGVALPPLLP